MAVKWVHILVAAVFSAGLPACAPASSVSAPVNARTFFEGKTLTYIVATEPGGGYDTYGRLVSRYLAKHLGMRRVVVENVPVGSHFRGANRIYASRPDGLTLGIFSTGLIYAQLLQLDGFESPPGCDSFG